MRHSPLMKSFVQQEVELYHFTVKVRILKIKKIYKKKIVFKINCISSYINRCEIFQIKKISKIIN